MQKLKNSTSQTGFLDNRDNLFSMLVALAKKNAGELRFTVDDLKSVKTSDMVGVLFDIKNEELVLRISEKGPMSVGTFMSH